VSDNRDDSKQKSSNCDHELESHDPEREEKEIDRWVIMKEREERERVGRKERERIAYHYWQTETERPINWKAEEESIVQRKDSSR
jgi:hypothetical protein